MRFGALRYSYLLWLVLLLVLFLWWSVKKRRRLLEGFAEKETLSEIACLVDFGRKRIRLAVIACAFLLAVIALMRPQWGFEWQEVKREALDIYIAIDTSKSMLARDVKPNRLERSKLAVRDLVKRLKGDRIGLIAFSGSAFVQCPLTTDYDGFLLSLDSIDTDIIPRPGTSIEKAIEAAADGFEEAAEDYRVLIIITDGEDHSGNPVKSAERAAAEGIKIFCVGIGTVEGELIQMGSGGKETEFLKDSSGNVVKTRLNETVLKKVALATGGTYVRSSGAQFGLDLIYERRLSAMERRELTSGMNKMYHERFQFPLALSLLLILIEPFIKEKKG